MRTKRSTDTQQPPRRKARILEIGPFPPPRAGWAVRIEFVKGHIESMGHICSALNIGESRKIRDDRYITVHNGWDYLLKVVRHSFKGFTLHVHTNGDVWPTGWALALIAELVGVLSARRSILTFHAGTHQVYFPRERSGWYGVILYVLFKLLKVIICNNNAVKEKIEEFGIASRKIVPISAFSKQYLEHRHDSLPEHVKSFMLRHDPVVSTYVALRDGYHLETLVDGIELLRKQWPRLGVISAGSPDDCDDFIRQRTLRRLEDAGIADHLCFAGDLPHEQFLSLLGGSKLYLRTPTTDGDSASVLESLALGIPVVAAENGNRPASVETYPAANADALCDRVNAVLSNWEESQRRIVRPSLRDTIRDEAELLIQCALNDSSKVLNMASEDVS